METSTADLRVMACNYTEGTGVCSQGALAYVRLLNPGWGHERIQILARSRGGRWVEKYENIRRLGAFRPKTIPAEHPLYARLKETTGLTDADEAFAEFLNERGDYWRNYTLSGKPR